MKSIVLNTPLINAYHVESFFIIAIFMSELKEHQPSITIEEQIVNLKNHGLIIEDEEYAKKVLSDITYFRLIKGFSVGLKIKNGNYYENVSFETLVELYKFNTEFRNLLFKKIELIEITFRSRVANYYCNHYGAFGYLDPNNYLDNLKFEEFKENVDKTVGKNDRTPFVINFKENYEGNKIPFYALVEISSFGMISKFYKNMPPNDKKRIASLYHISYPYFQSWIETISYVRNICAHCGRLYNFKLIIKPKFYPKDNILDVDNERIFGTLICIKRILKDDSNWIDFVNEIALLFKKYKNVKISTMGFVDNWEEILLGNYNI